MKTYEFTIYQAETIHEDFQWWHKFKVEVDSGEKALTIAKAMFRNYVEWYIIERGYHCTTAVDYRKLNTLSFVPEQGIADSQGNVIWPVSEQRSIFECEDGRFYLWCDTPCITLPTLDSEPRQEHFTSYYENQ